MKKAQGLSLNMIVVGAIALVVLVVIGTLFTTYSRKTNEEMSGVAKGARCELHGGHMTKITECEEAGKVPIPGSFYGPEYKYYIAANPKWHAPNPSVSINSDGNTYVCCDIS